jgi:hypothetical protein
MQKRKWGIGYRVRTERPDGSTGLSQAESRGSPCYLVEGLRPELVEGRALPGARSPKRLPKDENF